MKIPYIVMLAIGLAGAFSLGQAQVIISEVCTDNTRYEDEDTDTPDWFELHNVGDAAVNLDGWQLDVSEDSSQPWIIRHLVLQPGEVRLFFASGKDRPGSGNTIETYRPHTAFSLSNDGEELRLREPGPDSTSTHAITYPELGKNVGYGVKDDVEGYLFPVTPNERNTAAPSPNTLAPDVEFSHSGGIIKGPLELLLEVPGHPEAVIQYAFDGAEPSLFTPTYSGQPVVIDRTTTILARALLPDHLPSRLQGIGFILLDGDLNEFSETGETFSSNLPVIVIDTLGQNVDNSRAFKQTTISVTRPGEESGRTVLGEPAEYAGPAGVHLRGESSAGFGQKSYSLELRDEDEDDHDASLLGMPADSDWALYGPWSEKSLMRNKLTFDWMRELRGDDGTSMRSEFCELFLNQRGTETLGYDSYQGVYLLMEKIKRGQDRVPIENLNEYTVDPDMITGGYIIRKDKVDGGKDSWSTGTYNIPLQSFDPDRFNLEQLAYVKAYMNHFESALRGDDFTHPTKGYQKYIDVETFIDAQWFVEFTKQVDGYVFSTYWHKPRNGRLRAGPLWDFNISLGNADYATGDRSKGWLYDNRDGHGQIWYPRLHDDPEYHLAHWDRYWQMRHSMLSDDAVDAIIDTHMVTLLDGYSEDVGNREPESVQNPVTRHFRKFPHLGNRQWPNPPAETQIDTWQEEVDYMRDWFKDRLDWIDDQSMPKGTQVYRAPRLSHPGGDLVEAIDLEIIPHKGGLFDANKYPQETLYYTTDGTDPRLPRGDLNPEARVYSEPVRVDGTMTVQARLLDDGHWSPKSQGTYLLDVTPASAQNLIISEIMYHPADPTGIEAFSGLSNSGVFEYLELTNITANMIDLSGVRFTQGIQFDFSLLPARERLIPPFGSVLLVNHVEGFQRRHGDVDPTRIRGTYLGRLDNGGERLTLENAEGGEFLSIRYDDEDPWPIAADGSGFALVWAGLVDANPDEAEAWLISEAEGGTPGTHPVTDSGGGDPGTTEPDADSDRDGVTDGVEIAFGSDPKDPQSRYLPRLRANEASFQLLQRHHSGVSHDRVWVEKSVNLTDWEVMETGPSEISETHENDTVTRVWNLSPEDHEAKTFLRVRVDID